MDDSLKAAKVADQITILNSIFQYKQVEFASYHLCLAIHLHSLDSDQKRRLGTTLTNSQSFCSYSTTAVHPSSLQEMWLSICLIPSRYLTFLTHAFFL